MAEPKKRLTSTRTGNRRSHLAFTKKSLSSCPSCHEAILPHYVCENCGKYKNKPVLNLIKNRKKQK